jgi:hypothetical protein
MQVERVGRKLADLAKGALVKTGLARRGARSRMVGVAVGALLIGSGLSGCGPDLAGSAAVIGQSRITDRDLTQEVSNISSLLGAPASLAASAQITPVVLQRMIVQDLVNQLAAEMGISVTDGQLSEELQKLVKQVGTLAAVQQAVLTRFGFAPLELNQFLRRSLLILAIQQELSPTGTDAVRGALALAALGKVSANLDTRVSPRFGVWDAKTLTVSPPPDDLSAPPSSLGQNALQSQQLVPQ